MRIVAGTTREVVLAEYQNRINRSGFDKADPRLRIREADLQSAIEDLAARLRYRHYHTRNSKGSVPGYPDLHLVSGPRRMSIYAELKSTHGRLTNDQIDWLLELAEAGHHVYVWQPLDWLTNTIERTLKGTRI